MLQLYAVGVACIENGITIQSDKRPGWRNRSGRPRDGASRRVSSPDHLRGSDPYGSDDSVSDDAMEIDNMGNPNEF